MQFEALIGRITTEFPKAVLAVEEFRGDVSVRVRREDIAAVVGFLRDNPQQPFDFLDNLCGVDYLGRDPRFEVVIHLISTLRMDRICLKVGLPEMDPRMPSLTPLYVTANYQERETYDLLGITRSVMKRSPLASTRSGSTPRSRSPRSKANVAAHHATERLSYATRNGAVALPIVAI